MKRQLTMTGIKCLLLVLAVCSFATIALATSMTSSHEEGLSLSMPLAAEAGMDGVEFVEAQLVNSLESSTSIEEDPSAELSAAMLELSGSLELEHLVLQSSELDVSSENGIGSSASAEAAAFYRFARANNRSYGSIAATAQAFLTFKSNLRMAAELTTSSGDQTHFSSMGPMGDVDAATFKKMLQTTKHWKGRDKGKPVVLKGGAGKAAGSAGGAAQKSGKAAGQSGKTGGFAGGGVQKSGKAGGLSGAAAKKSGKAGGLSGSAAKKSGKSGGQSGGGVQKSGKTGGESGTAAKKSGKSGGASGKGVKKSGKTGGTGRTVTTDVHGLGGPAKPTKIVAPSNSATQNQNAFDKMMGLFPSSPAALKSVSVEKIRSTMAASGMSSSEIEATFSVFKGNMRVTSAIMLGANGAPMNAGFEQSTVCGSCWAFAATAAVQRFWSDAHKIGRISAQPVIDCVKTADSNGCKGGTPMDALDYFGRNFPALVDDYPETLRDGKCRVGPFAHTPYVLASAGWNMLVPACTDAKGNCGMQIKYEKLVAQWLSNTNLSPPIVYVDASQFQLYNGGLFDISKCKSTMDAGNHIVSIIGFGTEAATGIPYWLLENMWGQKWGENGRIRLPMGVNACGMMNFVIYPIPAQSILNPEQAQTLTKGGMFGSTVDTSKMNPADVSSNIIKGAQAKTYTAEEMFKLIQAQNAGKQATASGSAPAAAPAAAPGK